MIKYYNVLNEVTREIPKNHAFQFKDNESYYILNEEDPVNNPNFNETKQYNLLLDREKQIKLKELKEKILKKLIEQDSEFQTEKEKIEKVTALNILKDIKFNN